MLEEQVAPPSGFAALVNRIDRKLAGFIVLIAYLLQFLFLTSVEQLFVIQVNLCQSFNGKLGGKLGVKYSKIALIYQYSIAS